MKYLIKQLTPPFLRPRLKRLFARIYLTSPRLARAALGEVDERMRMRIADVMACPDNAGIPRVVQAGVMEGYHITMHNGVKVCAHSYYGAGPLNMLIENRGVHEPQEERAFDQIITLLPERPVMLELGAYWGFYSLSLLQARPQATCYLVEPDRFNITSGRINFRLNGRKGHFTRAVVGDRPRHRPKTISVDSFCEQHAIGHLHILHADIQGSELAMLAGARAMLSSHRIDYVFISTHSNELHAACSTALQSHPYVILASANLDQTYSVDGLIVAKRRSLPEPRTLAISIKPGRPSVAGPGR